MRELWRKLRNNWLVATLASVALVVAAVVAFLAALASIWTVMSRDTVPEFLAKRGWLSGWSMSAPPLISLGVMVAAIAILALLVALWIEARDSREVSLALTLFTHNRSDLKDVSGVEKMFVDAGWKVVHATTSLTQHSVGVWLHGGGSKERELARWALLASGIDPEIDTTPDNASLQVIVGATPRRYIHPKVQSELNAVIKERDAVVAAFTELKRQHALEVLDRYSKMRPRDGTPPTQVTIRYASYGSDYELAQKIQLLFTECVKWPVTLDASNNPALPRAERFKVVFDVGMTYTSYGELIHAFSDGELLGVSVGWRTFVERDDSHHIIVMVLPSVGAEPIQAEQA